MESMGKTLIVIGVVLVIAGLIVYFGPRLPLLGRLPGDIAIQKKNFSFHFPVTTCILISILLTLILFLLRRR